jgi:hypothetical protein
MRYLLLVAALCFANVCFAGFTPTVTSVSPNTGTPAGGTSVTVTGTSFTGSTAVHFGANAATTFTVDSNTQITATSPPGAGTVDVTVSNGGTSATSPADQFTYAVTPVRLQDFDVN